MSATVASSEGVLRREVEWGLIEFIENGHRYWITKGEQRRERYVSVTTFLDVLDKPALDRWREDAGIRNAIAAERAGLLREVGLDDVALVIRTNRMGSEQAMTSAQSRGVNVHKLAERFVTADEVPMPSDHPPEHRPYIVQLNRWLMTLVDRDFRLEAAEQLVAHPELRYAGRYDLRGTLDGLSHIIDLKTNRHGHVWDEHHVQPVAYAHAAMACGEESPYQCLVVAIGPESYEEVPTVATLTDVKAFLAAYRRRTKLTSAALAQRERLEASR